MALELLVGNVEADREFGELLFEHFPGGVEDDRTAFAGGDAAEQQQMLELVEVRIVGERVAEVAADGAVDGGGARIVFGHRFLYELELLRQRGPGGEVETGLARDAAHRLLRQIACPDAEVAGPFVARSVGSGAVVHRRECEFIQVVGQAAVGTDIADRLAGSHREAEQPVLSEADRPGQRGDFAVIQYDERHAGELFGDFKEDRPDSGCEFRFRNAAEQRRDARLVVHIDARGAAADRVDAGELGGGPLQRIDDPGAVVIDVLLEIRVPDDLLAVDGFAVLDRRAFAVGAAEVEADPAAVEVAAELHADLLARRSRVIGAAFDGEVAVVDGAPHHLVVESAFAVGRVEAGQPGGDLRAAADGDFPAAARPEQELHDALDVAQVERIVGLLFRQDRGVEARHGAVGPFEADGEPDHRLSSGGGDQFAVFPVPEGGREEARIEFGREFHGDVDRHGGVLLSLQR